MIVDGKKIQVAANLLQALEKICYYGVTDLCSPLANLWYVVKTALQLGRITTSDPRDMIFALYGIANFNTGKAKTIEPDYSLTCWEVFARATALFLTQVGPSMLELSSYKPNPDPHTPSWIVDWSQVSFGCIEFPESSKSHWQNSFAYMRSLSGRHILAVSAVMFGRIKLPPVELLPYDGSLGRTAEVRKLNKYLSDLGASVKELLSARDYIPQLKCLARAMLQAQNTAPQDPEKALNTIWKALDGVGLRESDSVSRYSNHNKPEDYDNPEDRQALSEVQSGARCHALIAFRHHRAFITEFGLTGVGLERLQS